MGTVRIVRTVGQRRTGQACQWIGNSQAVAAKHYLQTTDEHYERALQ